MSKNATLVCQFFSIKPWKIKMEPTNHPFKKENDLNQTSIIMFHDKSSGVSITIGTYPGYLNFLQNDRLKSTNFWRCRSKDLDPAEKIMNISQTKLRRQ